MNRIKNPPLRDNSTSSTCLKVYSGSLISGLFCYWSVPEMANGWKYTLANTIKINTGIIPPRPFKCDWFNIDDAGVLTIFKEYSWDGATMCPDHESIIFGSCVHDVFCQLNSLGVFSDHGRAAGDKLLSEIVKNEMIGRINSGNSKYKAIKRVWAAVWSKVVYAAVRLNSMRP